MPSEKETLRAKIVDIALLIHRREVFSELIALGKLPQGDDPASEADRSLIATLEELCLTYVEEVNGDTEEEPNDREATD